MHSGKLHVLTHLLSLLLLLLLLLPSILSGGLVLGCVTGHVLMGQALPEGGYSNWQLVAKLPTAVHSMCMTTDGAAPAAIQRT
jgi:hypothetical protein